MKETKKNSGYFSSYDGTKIYYEVRGSGRPLIFCYGLACLMNHWIHQVRYFSQSYQTILFDYRGHHASEKPRDPGELTLAALCKDIDCLMNHLGIEKASFWGHSFGVQVLVKLFELYPQRIHDLIFINGFVSNPIKGMFGVDFLPLVFSKFKQGYDRYPDLVGFAWRNLIDNPALHPLASLAGGFNFHLTKIRDIEVYAKGVSQIDLDVFIAFFSEMMNYDGHSTLSTINVPTLIVSGTKDGVTPQSYQAELHHLIGGSQFITVPYGSHCTQLDLPELVNLRAEKFLREFAWSEDTNGPKTIPYS